MEDISSYFRFLMISYTLFGGLGFMKKSSKDEKAPEAASLSSSAPTRLTSRKKEGAEHRAKSDLERVKQMDGATASGSPTSTTQPIAIQGRRQRSATTRSGAGSKTASRSSLHSMNSVGSGGSGRRLGHGTPGSHHGSRSVIGSFIGGSAGSNNSGTPQSYSKSHEMVWNQAYRNACR
eukprot:gene10496-19208_t